VNVADIKKEAVILASLPVENERLGAIEARLMVIEERIGIV
jgi:hypothetical protein